MAALTRTSTGRLYGPDDFSTSPYDVLANGWTNLVGAVAIESGELSIATSGGGFAGQAQTIATYTDQVVSLSFKRHASSLVRLYLRYYVSGGMYSYVVDFEAARAVLRKVVNGVWAAPLWPAITCDASTRYGAKISIIGSAIKVWFDGALIIDTDEPGVPGPGRVVLYPYHATANTAHSHFDDICISSANSITCSGLPDGWDLVCGSLSAAASGGTATVDLASQPIPQTAAFIKNSGDATKWSYGETWGGDVFALNQRRVVELYSYAGVYMQDLTATDVSWDVDRSRSVRRNASFSVPYYELPQVRVPGRRVKIYDGDAQRFEGSIDSADIARTPGSGMVSVACRDKTKTYKLARFAADTAYEDADARESPNLVASAAASSEAGAGEGILGGKVYNQKTEIYTAGGSYWVESYWWYPPLEDPRWEGVFTPGYWVTVPSGWSSTGVNATGSILGGDYSAAFLVSATKYRLDFCVDLYAQHAVTSVVVTTNGTATVTTSTNGTTWLAYAPGTYRYLHVTIERTASPITCGVAVVGSTAHGAALVLTDGADYWMPQATDADRYLTLTLAAVPSVANESVGVGDGTTTTFGLDWFPVTAASETIKVDGVAKTRTTHYNITNATGVIVFTPGNFPTFGQLITAAPYTYPTLGRNVLYLRWGLNDADRTTRYVYNIQTSATGLDGSWTTVVTGAHGTPNRLCEHVLTLSTNLYIRVVITSANAPVALRFAKVQYIDSSNDIGTIIQTIAATEGETVFTGFTATRQYLRWVGYEQGEEKWAAMESLAASIGFELFYTASGVLTFRPAEDIDVTLATKQTYSAMLTLDAGWTDGDIYNQIIAVYEDANAAYRYVALNDNASSPTGTPNVGTRTSPTMKSTTANSQAKVEAWARYLLDLYSRQPARGEFPMSAIAGLNPGDIAPTSLEPGDVVHLHDPASDVDEDFVVDSYSVSDTGSQYDIRVTVSEAV
jgi:hypothetical protein